MFVLLLNSKKILLYSKSLWCPLLIIKRSVRYIYRVMLPLQAFELFIM